MARVGPGGGYFYDMSRLSGGEPNQPALEGDVGCSSSPAGSVVHGDTSPSA